MELILKGKDCGFSWSAAHLLPGHFKCSRMHGHNYVMDLQMESDELKNGMIMDFVEVKKTVREMIELYDHKLMLPDMLMLPNSHLMKVDIGEFVTIKFTDNDKVKVYSIPEEDVVIIDINSNFMTAENLALYFSKKLTRLLGREVCVTVWEDNGQGVKICQ